MAKRKVRGIRQPHAARLLYVKKLYDLIERIRCHPGAGDLSHRRRPVPRVNLPTYFSVFLEGIAQKTELVTESGFQAQMLALFGGLPVIPGAKSQLRSLFVQENIKLITSLSDNIVANIETLLIRSLRQGSHVREIEKQMQAEIGLSKRRARLIARDQVNKYSGDLTKHHQKEAGITHYRWETSGDSRVRDRHHDLNGKTFAWAKPPISDKSGGRFHPRQGINCRCDAIPAIAGG